MRYISLVAIGCLFFLSGCGGGAQNANTPTDKIKTSGAGDISAINSAEGITSLPPIPKVPQDRE